VSNNQNPNWYPLFEPCLFRDVDEGYPLFEPCLFRDVDEGYPLFEPCLFRDVEEGDLVPYPLFEPCLFRDVEEGDLSDDSLKPSRGGESSLFWGPFLIILLCRVC